ELLELELALVERALDLGQLDRRGIGPAVLVGRPGPGSLVVSLSKLGHQSRNPVDLGIEPRLVGEDFRDTQALDLKVEVVGDAAVTPHNRSLVIGHWSLVISHWTPATWPPPRLPPREGPGRLTQARRTKRSGMTNDQ